ncbi:hypothetical protein PK98_01170 [Croceibacterium mercuriale]|uniref:Cytochrome c domain-containing protein n=1 Tax=Croceibacterium mercuriale TaxID=1572751 RepID=A0A0B2C066_9SPHN|nr:cytochrome c [Croceibacterium mercuriale]KHL25366.1 hypothetical protein PK98_01170 [Croceibacterium mercuriale]
MKQIQWRSFGFGVLALSMLLFAAALITVLTGAYDVAADDRHTPLVGWGLDTTMRNSVQSRADNLTTPAFTPAMIASGAGEYKAMCQHCHGGIGAERAEWAGGMRPHPPALASAAKGWSPEEVFWLVKHGIKMSGMPAFGGSHDDPTIWNIAAFVKAMPTMSAERYAAYASEGGDHGNGDEAGQAHHN